MSAQHTCKWSIFDPDGVTKSCALPLGHKGSHADDVLFRGVYLGVAVEVVADYEDGWVKTRWPDGREWRQWKSQVTHV